MNMLPLAEPFRPHPNFDDAINRAICQSEIEGGVSLDSSNRGRFWTFRPRRLVSDRKPRRG